MGQKIWAEAIDVPGRVCTDAHLSQGGQDLKYPNGSVAGQAGWEIGLRFQSLADLADQLEKSTDKRDKIERLAIHAHGYFGVVYPEGRGASDFAALEIRTIPLFIGPLARIRETTTATATIMFVGCLAGGTSAGSAFLTTLSKLFPGRSIVAFTTIGYVSGDKQARPGKQCSEPGMRDTNRQGTNLDQKQIDPSYAPIWNDLGQLPWASETSPHAKVFRDGRQIKGPTEGEEPHHRKLAQDAEMKKRWEDVVELRKTWDRTHRREDNERRQQAIKSLKLLLMRRDHEGVSFDPEPWNLKENQHLLDAF